MGALEGRRGSEQQGRFDRRRQRRVNFQVPIQIRRAGTEGLGPPEDAVAINVSLAGVYFESPRGQTYAPNESIMVSISIPEPLQREFPFTRLAGRSRVVRVDALPGRRASDDTRQGVALEFGEHVTALSAMHS